jgi:hypothetical protein
LFSCKLACPLSSLSDPEEAEELEEELDEEEPLELSENIPLCFDRSTLSASVATSGNLD